MRAHVTSLRLSQLSCCLSSFDVHCSGVAEHIMAFGSSPPGWPRPWSRQMQRAAAFAFAPLMTGELRPISGTLNLCMGRGLQVRRRRQC
ncbi:hypothetical protein PYCCODRAFT_91262 [Trametes coccinea BRFM310]|uniref:Uncharacterized protein n=1 Tax=Trametes coccinea (strain BRFM310) TaxID=1353009 RepID=A0A1Y2I5C6_TRAC3|nr:hypothetical protein PYCCODRAFT_91262 [Trametes coccinea BRFM310]